MASKKTKPGEVQLLLALPADLHKRFKLATVAEGTTMRGKIRELVLKFLEGVQRNK